MDEARLPRPSDVLRPYTADELEVVALRLGQTVSVMRGLDGSTEVRGIDTERQKVAALERELDR